MIKEFMRKAMALLVSITMVLIVLPTFPAHATQTRKNNFSTSYTLTGNGAQDIINVAMAQIGKTGSDLGYSEEWCADFVSDCADLAGQGDAVPRTGAVSNEYTSARPWWGLRQTIIQAGGHDVGLDNAQPGDIVFFSGHVEIVYSGTGSSIVSIGGNTGNGGSCYSRVVCSPRKHGSPVAVLRPNYSGGYHDPEGFLDSAEGGYGTVTLTGWALDRDTPDEACEIHIYMDGPSGQGGTCIATGIMADQPSPDVASIIGVGGNHRFNATLNLDVTGNHTFYAYAINRGGGNHNPELYNYFTTYIYEKTNSVISNVYISSVTPSGFTVNVAVSDESKVGRIAVPVWTTHKAADHGNYESGQDDLLYNWQNLSLAKKIGTNTYVFDVSTLDHNDESGEYNIDVYAYNPDGSQIDRWCLETNHRTYANVPSEKILSNVSVTNLTPSGYTLQISVTDDSNIGRIAVPVWTSYVAKETGSYEPGQDDLLSGWQDCSVARQTDKNLYVFEVSTIEHNSESGEYNNDIYVFDKSGNIVDRWCLETKHRTYVDVPNDTVINKVAIENTTPFGYDVVVSVADDSLVNKIAVPVWTSYVAKETSAYEPGQDDLISGWGSKCLAEKMESNKYVYHVSTSDHNNESGEYCNDIYVYDDSGKLLDRWCMETKHRTYAYVPDFISGDVNLDGVCNVSDVVLLQKWLLAVPDTHLACWQAADLCQDERLDVFDLCLMKRMLLSN